VLIILLTHKASRSLICINVITKRMWRSNYQAILSLFNINYSGRLQFATYVQQFIFYKADVGKRGNLMVGNACCVPQADCQI